MTHPLPDRLIIGQMPMRIALDLHRAETPMPYDRDTLAARYGVNGKTIYNAVSDLVTLGAVERHTSVSKEAGKVHEIVAVPAHPLWAYVAAVAAELDGAA